MALTPSAADAQVTASFTYAPTSPLTFETITFADASQSDGEVNSWTWDFGDGTIDYDSGRIAVHSYLLPGDYTVRLVVADSLGGSDVHIETVHISNRGPNASFTFDPPSPGTGQRVTFTSTSTDPEGRIDTHRWDFNNDGKFDDASGTTVDRSFLRPGNQVVGLLVTDKDGGASQTFRTVPVGNRPPSASFGHSPDPPLAGDSVSFFSTATDPDGPIVDQAWDLDGDGAFDDASGTSATRVFAAAGSYTIGLRVVDDDGVATAAVTRLEVLPRLADPGSASGLTGASGGARSAPRLLNPFPIVRIVGTVTRRGVRLRRLLVDAPSGATVSVSCRGRRCPLRKRTRIASKPRHSVRAHAARVIRFRRLERRLLRAGVRIKVLVTKPDAIGKYTLFRIRKRRSPARVDRCLVPGQPKPVRCSAT